MRAYTSRVDGLRVNVDDLQVMAASYQVSAEKLADAVPAGAERSFQPSAAAGPRGTNTALIGWMPSLPTHSPSSTRSAQKQRCALGLSRTHRLTRLPTNRLNANSIHVSTLPPAATGLRTSGSFLAALVGDIDPRGPMPLASVIEVPHIGIADPAHRFLQRRVPYLEQSFFASHSSQDEEPVADQ
jgi:hypothetical protein